MKALILKGLNEPLSFEEVSDPIAEPEEVIVDIHAAAFNRRDFWISKGMYPGIKFPIILGSDGAGVVNGRKVVIYPAKKWGGDVAVQSADFEVLGLPENGCFAEQVSVLSENIYDLPSHLTMAQGAALPLAGLTAYRALFSRAKLAQRDKVLISGVGGGVAIIGLQMALANGNEVYVTSGSDAKIEQAVALGAQGGVNYKNEEWWKELKKMAGGFDVTLDSAAGDSFSKFVDLANPGGRISFYGGTRGKINHLNPQKIFWKQLSILGSTMGSPKEFEQLLDLVELHDIVPVVDEVLPMTSANDAFEKMKDHSQFGKIVLGVR